MNDAHFFKKWIDVDCSLCDLKHFVEVSADEIPDSKVEDQEMQRFVLCEIWIVVFKLCLN